jgi:hypothetical protein
LFVEEVIMERIKISIGRTYNLGNYESFRLDVGSERDVLDGTPVDEAAEQLFKECATALQKLEEQEGLK